MAIVFAAAAAAATGCYSNSECAYGEVCLKNGKCQQLFTGEGYPGAKLSDLPDSCFQGQWPNLTSCAVWKVDEELGVRTLESNDVPPYHVYSYCPFGVGQGYCNSPSKGNSTDCPPFRGLKCPCTPGERGCPQETPSSGDVMVAVYQKFEFPLNPDPTDASKPKHMYDNKCLKNGNSYQVIGAHLNGVQIKGPAEANGFNVDTTLIPLPCGGHVTPPVGPGPVYHYHKPADCTNISIAGQHGPLIGWAADGFGIYGFGDVSGASVLDECNGHFGELPDGSIGYHYHAVDHYNMDGEHHVPYHMGCQGPSKGKCKSTISEKYDYGADWCGAGCGYEICVQPGTSNASLTQYLSKYPGGASWLSQFTVNPY
eukprot:TRINITY_DN10426_c0_g1_i1.p1 TRINITY_DN10426_c0_g1~~TRINITY_DN10426_c0_g1_i1.p1  ORF type:complete len:369 (+),score=67.35 TRINITY_DN10426_c0_g1_i1:50-1156(+)